MLGYFKHVLTLPMNFFTTRKSGEIISRFLDANKIIDALANATLSIFLDIGMVLLVGVTLAIQNHTLFLITLVSLPFYLISIFSFVRSYEKANSEELATGANLNSSIIESLKGIETIKAYNGEERVYTRVSEEFILLMNKSLTTATLDNVQQGIKKVIQLISNGEAVASIGRSLNLHIKTIYQIRLNLIKKLGCSGRTDFFNISRSETFKSWSQIHL